jgi:photosystem II stability/assembly factor-like uncharacterized protein
MIVIRLRQLPVLAIVLLLTSAGSASAHHPHDVTGHVRLSPDFAQDRTVFATIEGTFDLLLRSTDGGDSWHPSHEGTRTRAVTDIDFSPDYHNDGRVYVSDARVGVDVSFDRGDTWFPTAIQRGGIEALALSPDFANDQLLLCGSLIGLLRSTDGGASFSVVHDTTTYSMPLEIVYSPSFAQDQTIYSACRRDAVLLSTDAGLSWQPADPTLEGIDARDLALAVAADSTQLLALATWGDGLLVSTDHAASWQPLWPLDADPFLTAVTLSPAYATDGIFYVTTRSGGVYRSDNGGADWLVEDLGFIPLTAQTDTHWRGVELSPDFANDGRVFVNMFEGLRINRPDPRGEWYSPRLLPTRIGRRARISPDFPTDSTIVATGYGFEILYSEDAGSTWEIRNRGSLTISNYSMALSPTFGSDGFLLSGAGWGIEYSLDRGLDWHAVAFPVPTSGATKAIQFSPQWPADSTVYAGNWYNILKSPNGGRNWEVLYDLPQRCYDMAISPDYPTDPSVWMVSSNLLLHTSDDGISWQEIAPGSLGNGMRHLEVSPDFAADSTLWIGYFATGILRSTNGGRTWTDLRAQLASAAITGLAVSNNYASDRTLFAGTHSSGVLLSTDGGDSWERRWPQGLEGGYVESIEVSAHFATDSTLVAGSYGGFYLSQNGGRTWRLITHVERYEDSRQDTAILRPGGEPLRASGSGSNNLIALPNASPLPSWILSSGKPLFTESTMTLGRDAGSTYTFWFHGHGFRWLGYLGPDAGRVTWSLDQGATQSLDLWAPDPQPGAEILRITDLAETPHRFDITIEDTGENGRWDSLVGIDAFDVFY